MKSSNSFISVATGEGRERRLSPRLNQLPGQTGDSDKDPRPDNVVALTPVESTTRPVCNNIMCRSGVYPNWLNAEHVKKSASGYGKYGTKQDCIEGALEELETMIEHYNHNCKAKMGSKMY